MASPNYQYLDCSLDQWRKLVKDAHPNAVIYVAPEEEGGTRTALDGDKFVGDWDGSAAPYGRIVVTPTC